MLPDEELADVRQLDRLRASFDNRSDLIEDVRAAVAGQLGDEAGRGHARDYALAVEQLDMRKLDLLDRCPEARARERVAPATAAVGGRLTAEWAKDSASAP